MKVAQITWLSAMLVIEHIASPSPTPFNLSPPHSIPHPLQHVTSPLHPPPPSTCHLPTPTPFKDLCLSDGYCILFSDVG